MHFDARIIAVVHKLAIWLGISLLQCKLDKKAVVNRIILMYAKTYFTFQIDSVLNFKMGFYCSKIKRTIGFMV